MWNIIQKRRLLHFIGKRMAIKYNLNELNDNTMNYRFDFLRENLLLLIWRGTNHLILFYFPFFLYRNCRVFVQIISNGLSVYVNTCGRIGSGASAIPIYCDCVLYAALTCFQRVCVSRTHIWWSLSIACAYVLSLYIKTTRIHIAHDNKYNATHM